MAESTLVKMGALWINQGKNGEYFAGKLGDAKLLMFANDKKGNDKAPDYNLYVAPYQKKDDNQSRPGPAPAQTSTPASDDGDSDIPF